MNNLAISVKKLSKVYNLYKNHTDRLKEVLFFGKKSLHTPFYALQDITFEVEKGTAVGIIGKNGSGKSTLLKIISGVLSPTEGEAVINGRVAALLELGAGFDPEKTGIENIYFVASIMGIEREEIDERIDDILEFADVGEFIYQAVKSYSSGMFARVAFSLFVNIDPDILIVDEALSVGDAFFQHKCMRKIKELQSRGVTLLFVSHSIEAVIELCDKAILLENGKMIMQGDTKEVSKEYYNRTFHGENQITLSKMDVDANRSVQEDMNVLKPLLQKAVESLDASNLFKIDDVKVVDKDNNIRDSYIEGDYVYVILSLISYYDIDNISLAIEIKDSQGSLLTGESTFNKFAKVLSFKKGEPKKVIFKFKLNLTAGQYAIRFRINRLTKWDRSDNLLIHLNEEAAIMHVSAQKNSPIWFKFRQEFDIEVIE